MAPIIVGSGGTGFEGKSDRIGLPVGTSDPSSSSAGELYFNSSTNKVRQYNGTAWSDLVSSLAPDGSASSPAVSAAQLLADYPEKPSGIYYLQTPGGSTPVYCEMERQGGGWILALQHSCTNDEGLYNDLLSGTSGTPNSSVSDFKGAGSLSVQNLWDQYIGSGGTGMLYSREIQYSGGTYDETHQYVSATGGNVYTWSNFSNLFTAASGAPANGSYQTGIRVIYKNGTKQVTGKQQTVWSSPSLVTINNGNIDQELYFCNGQDGGDNNWSFALMRGGTPYPRLADAANGGNRHSGITRWAQVGFRSAGVAVPCDPFADNSGVAYFPLTATFAGKSIGNTQWNGTASGNGSYQSDGYTQTDSGANGFTIPAPNSDSIGSWFTGNQEWTMSISFKLVSSPSSATNRGLIHMSAGNDYDRPGLWIAGPGRTVPNVLEYFSSSNGTSWDIARGDTAASGRGSTTISPNTWYHVVFTRSATTGLRGYVNGNLDWSDSNTAQHFSSGDYSIVVGNWWNNSSTYGLHGSIKNVRFFRKHLSSGEAAQLYALDI